MAPRWPLPRGLYREPKFSDSCGDTHVGMDKSTIRDLMVSETQSRVSASSPYRELKLEFPLPHGVGNSI